MADQVLNVLSQWGLANADVPSLYDQAVRIVRYQEIRSGELVTALGYASRDEVEAAMASKPSNVLALEHLSQKIPAVRENLQRLLAVLYSIPYFTSVDEHWIHPALAEFPALINRIDELNAVLLKTPAGTPLLLFTSYDSLAQYERKGPTERQKDILRRQFGAELRFGLCDSNQFLMVTRRIRRGSDLGRVLSADSQDTFWTTQMVRTEYERVLSQLFDLALARKATDLALFPMLDGTSQVMIRVNGDLVEPERHARLSVAATDEIVRFLLSKSRAGDGGRLLEPADGQMTYRSADAEWDMRLSFIPADRVGYDHDMISVSARFLKKGAQGVSLSSLNLQPHVQEAIQQALYSTKGLILLAGPTNSGKSTTIAGVVGEHVAMYGMTKKRLSIENPVERRISGITQITVMDNFATLLRAALRHDPDLLWVGEIRDAYSAAACVRASNSGHLSLSTVHANDSILAFRAVANYLKGTAVEEGAAGASYFDLAESLTLILGQRLVKHICPHCRTAAAPTPEFYRMLDSFLKLEGIPMSRDAIEAALRSGVPATATAGGCQKCAGSGYIGELPVSEVLPVSREVRGLLAASSDRMHVDKIVPHRTLTLFESSLSRVVAGEIEMSALFL